jgi:tRNA uridine 5-carboxymethylaminomethyl modification enzyme
VLDNTPLLDVWQDQADELLTESVLDGSSAKTRVVGVKTIWGAEIRAKAVIITAGTFLNGLMHIGRKMVPGGRIAEPAVANVTESITRHGIRSARMKTGTPVRIDKRSVHFEDMERQDGENGYYKFSYMGEQRPLQQLPCWVCYTNEEVHKTLRSGLADSPLYNGQIQSIGPRYCPSIETKLVTFPDRPQHLLFLEPEGEETNEMYLNGFSSSLPMEVQLTALRKIPALKDAVAYRPGYAIEYDFFDPTQLNHTLESKVVENLYFAGQVNGTTGYEEAAGQGLIAGINAALKVQDKGTFTLKRDEAYIGVLIDDLVTKGVDEPYRMFTSRAEYRILLREDDADMRLTRKAYEIGLADNERYEALCRKEEQMQELTTFIEGFSIKPHLINEALESMGTAPLSHGCKLISLIERPQISILGIAKHIKALNEKLQLLGDDKEEIAEAVEIQLKYKGYIERERELAEKSNRLENIRIKGKFNYSDIQSLSTEARQKLTAIDPDTLAQASRIPGVSPSDINVLLILAQR